MKLYYKANACSLAPHIALSEAELPYTLERVDLRTHKLDDGSDYYAINPKGYVPTLEIEGGQRLTEAQVILQYIADRKPGTLAPAFGTFERYQLMEWLNFIATELHKGFSPLFKPNTPDAYKTIAIENIGKRFDLLEPVLAKQSYLTGQSFSIADAYLYTIVSWHKGVKMDLNRWPSLVKYQERVAARPKVRKALAEEDLIKEAA
jgi:glutathione S-transferase